MPRPAKSPFAECRDCHAPIIWAELEGGKKRPIDRNPVPNGRVVLFRNARTGRIWGRYLSRGQALPPGGKPRRCHFDTCSAKKSTQH